MKQHIEVAQLDELTITQKEKLYIWWQDHISVGDVVWYERWGGSGVVESINIDPNPHWTKGKKPYYYASNDASPGDEEWNIHAERYYPLVIDADMEGREPWIEEPLPLLSIGQMMELLMELDTEWYCQTMKAIHAPTIIYNAWSGERKETYTPPIDLIDTLWIMIKARL